MLNIHKYKIYHEYEPPGRVLAYDAAGSERGNELKFKKSCTAYDADSKAAVQWLTKHPLSTGKACDSHTE